MILRNGEFKNEIKVELLLIKYYICIRFDELDMQLRAGNHICVNAVVFNIEFIGKLARSLTYLNEGIRKLPYSMIRFFLAAIMVLVLVVFSPMLYLVIIVSIRKFKKSLLHIESQLPQLSISELNELITNLNKSFKSCGIDSENLSEIQAAATFFIQPLHAIITDVCREIYKIDCKINERIELQYKLFDEALNTDTLIGANEEIESR